jgi:hypothetical protein
MINTNYGLKCIYSNRLNNLPIKILKNILDNLFYNENLKLKNLLELKNTCKLLYSVISDYIEKFIKNKKIFKNEYKEESKDNEPKIYVFINNTQKVNIEKRYITIKNNNRFIYSYNYFIHIRNFDELYKLFKLNIFKNISLKNLLLLNKVYVFSYIISCHEYVKINSLKLIYTPVFNNIYLYFSIEKNLSDYVLNDFLHIIKNIKILNILEFNCYYKYKLEFVNKILDYIYDNNIKIKIIKWNIFLDLTILHKLYINKNIHKVIISNYKNKRYINNKKYDFMFKEKIKIMNH